MAIIHNDPCGGTILFETPGEAAMRLAAQQQTPPLPPREYRQLYCSTCGAHWDRKREMWNEAHAVEDA